MCVHVLLLGWELAFKLTGFVTFVYIFEIRVCLAAIFFVECHWYHGN